jgi:hypothetical protein
MSAKLIQAVAVTAELCGRTFSEAAARVFVMDLGAYPEEQVIKALTRCRKEVRGVLTVSDVINRLDDGRPGAEEAWAMLPKSEAESAVWTDEMREAYAVASSLLAQGDEIAARMAFKESYQRRVIDARDAGTVVRWEATLGTDRHLRERAVTRAVEAGRLTHDHAMLLLPAPEAYAPEIVGLLAGPNKVSGPPEEIKRRLAELRSELAQKRGRHDI